MEQKKISFFTLFFNLLLVLFVTGCGDNGISEFKNNSFDSAQPPPIIVIPESGLLEIPIGFTSGIDFPIVSNVDYSIDTFSSASNSYLLLLNMSDTLATTELSISKQTKTVSVRRATALDKPSKHFFSEESNKLSPEHSFHLWLRKQSQNFPIPSSGSPSIRGSLRNAKYSIGDHQNFSIFKKDLTRPEGYRVDKIETVCKLIKPFSGSNKKTYFFIDKNDVLINGLDQVIEESANKWQDIYDTNIRVFGDEPDGILSNGIDATDFYILISRKVFTAGYYYSGDLISNTLISDSNEKKIFYMQLNNDSDLENNFQKNRMIIQFQNTMAHEFQHMIHDHHRGEYSDVWLEEALSGYAEYINGFKIENRNTQSRALQVNKYFEKLSELQLDSWYSGNANDSTVHAHYGKAYLFGVWLAQNYGSADVIASLLEKQGHDVDVVTAFTGKNFGTVYSEFMLALLVNDYTSADNRYGIKGLNLEGNYPFDYGLANVRLNRNYNYISAKFADGRPDSFRTYPRAATVIHISDGDDQELRIESDLPNGVALFEIRK